MNQLLRELENILYDSHNFVKPFLPYDMYKVEDGYILELAVAGYKKQELSLEVTSGILLIKGTPKEKQGKEGVRGIAKRAFSFTIPLSTLYEVNRVILEDGILSIKFVKDKKATKVIKIQ